MCIYKKPNVTSGNVWGNPGGHPSLWFVSVNLLQCQEHVYIAHVHVLVRTGCVAVGKRLKGIWVHHALVEHQSVLLGEGADLELFGGRMSREKMGDDHGHVASVVEGVSEFVEDVLPQDVVI